MSVRHVKYLLIGGGVAGLAAAEAIRQLDDQGSILVVGQEIVRPYLRPPLSKEYLRRQMAREVLFAQGKDWFEQNRVDFHSGRRAAHLDVVRSALSLDRGEVIGYDKLLLATGMTPKLLDVPGARLPGLFYLRTLEDANHIQTAVDNARGKGLPHSPGAYKGPRGVAAVIGAGLLGTELAASLTQLGLAVDLLCAHAHPLDKLIGEVTGKALLAYMVRRGVRVHGDARCQRIEGDGRVQRVTSGDGKWFHCDFAVAAVGATALRDLLRGTPIAAEKAILTDAHCRTNILNIFAAGDCAAIFDPLFGKHRILDHWDHALLSGALAGRNMAGRNEAYASVNSFSSQVFDLSIRGWGEPRLVERRLVRSMRAGDENAPEIIEFGIAADGRICQIIALGCDADYPLLRDLVGARLSVAGREEKLKDPALPLRDLLQ